MIYHNKEKIFITGSPGSGTSFMCLLLHRLGLDSGYDNNEFHKEAMAKRGKGAEYLTDKIKLRELNKSREQGIDNSPPLIKKPFMPNWDKSRNLKDPSAITVFDFARKYNWDIESLIITVRDYDKALKANRRHDLITRNKIRDKYDDEKIAKLWICYGLYQTIYEAMEYNITFSLIHFPRLIESSYYLYGKINHLIKQNYDEFKLIHKELANLDMVHIK